MILRVLGASRKRMIGALSNEAPADQRLAIAAPAAAAGVGFEGTALVVGVVQEEVQRHRLAQGPVGGAQAQHVQRLAAAAAGAVVPAAPASTMTGAGSVPQPVASRSRLVEIAKRRLRMSHPLSEGQAA